MPLGNFRFLREIRLLSGIVLAVSVILFGSQNCRAADAAWGGTFVGKTEAGREITIVAWQSGLSSEVTGFELDGASKNILLLHGVASHDGWTITESPDSQSSTGTIRGTPGPDSFDGNWRSPDGSSIVPLHLRRDQQQDLQKNPEIRRQSQDFAKCAFQAAVTKEYKQAIFFLRLYRATNESHPYTDVWEKLFEAELAGSVSSLYKEVSRTGDLLMIEAVPYMEDQRGDIEAAKRTYREQCLIHPSPFTCLMYASFSERIGDRIGMLEGYDYACRELSFACARAYGPAETEFIADVASGNTVKALGDLRQGSLNVNAKQGQALYQAVLHNSVPLVREPLAQGADPYVSADILYIAISNRFSEILRLLLDNGADANLGEPLFAAVDKNNLPIAEELIKKGADVNFDDAVGRGTALMGAAEDNNRDMVRLLLRYGADPTASAKFHESPLVSTHDPEIKRMLRQAIRECMAGTRKCGDEN